MLNFIAKAIKREWLLAYRQRTEYYYSLLFLLMVATLFPLAISPKPELLQQIGAGVIWVATVLTVILSLLNLYREDLVQGCFYTWALPGMPLALLLLIKILAQWLLLITPVIIFSGLLGAMYHLSILQIKWLLLGLLLATPTLYLLGAMLSSFTVGLSQSGLLLVILLLPLYIPILIFSTQLVNLAVLGLPVSGLLALLSAFLLLALIISPVLSAWSIRLSLAYEH